MGEVCELCYDSYINETGKCQESTVKVENCLQYLEEAKCKFCQHGYFVNEEGTCSEITIDKCAEVNA